MIFLYFRVNYRTVIDRIRAILDSPQRGHQMCPGPLAQTPPFGSGRTPAGRRPSRARCLPAGPRSGRGEYSHATYTCVSVANVGEVSTVDFCGLRSSSLITISRLKKGSSGHTSAFGEGAGRRPGGAAGLLVAQLGDRCALRTRPAREAGREHRDHDDLERHQPGAVPDALRYE
jgi:hypothetical protein